MCVVGTCEYGIKHQHIINSILKIILTAINYQESINAAFFFPSQKWGTGPQCIFHLSMQHSFALTKNGGPGPKWFFISKLSISFPFPKMGGGGAQCIFHLNMQHSFALPKNKDNCFLHIQNTYLHTCTYTVCVCWPTKGGNFQAVDVRTIYRKVKSPRTRFQLNSLHNKPKFQKNRNCQQKKDRHIIFSA